MHRRVLFGQLAQHLDRLAHGVGVLHGDELGGHHAARGAVLVPEEAPDLGRVLDAHQAQKCFGLLVGEVADDVDGVVRVHVAEDVRGFGVVEILDEVGLVLVLHFRDGLGGLVLVEVLEHVGALLRVELFQDVGDVCGVQLVKAFVRDGKLHLGEVAIEQVHVVPCDDLLVDLLVECLRHLDDRAFEPGGKPAQDAADADLGTEKSQLVTRLGKLQVVYAHDFKALRIDDLPIHEVAREQDLIGLKIAETDVLRLDAELDALVVELVDVLAPGNHEGNFARTLEREAGYAGKHLAG